uniref:Uncharacterized protein LOC111109394 n=1 Tax=Crassostrea virginica TaxID=6565 RepID=A0A8B8BDW4_CRAVI|nr:uncharacterized protein LOC111109394 [Crassostrea virginica]
MKKHSQSLIMAVDKRGEIWYRELGAVIENKKSEIAIMESEILSALDKEEGEINEKMSEVRERILELELEELTNSRNVYNVSMYTSLDDTFESSLAHLHVALPRFRFRDINREALEEQFGYLSPIYNVRIPEGASNVQPKALLDEPKFSQVMKTQYTEINKLRSVSSLKDDEMWTCGQDKVMRLKWRPRGICSTASGDVLVIMDRLFHTKYLSENRNWDICVADHGASAVVVVSAVGKLRFRYTGPLSTFDESFDPVGIATDSQARILVADCDNHRIHIQIQHGHFLRYNEDPDLRLPRGYCVDSRDTLLVAEATTGKVKKIQYNKEEEQEEQEQEEQEQEQEEQEHEQEEEEEEEEEEREQQQEEEEEQEQKEDSKEKDEDLATGGKELSGEEKKNPTGSPPELVYGIIINFDYVFSCVKRYLR